MLFGSVSCSFGQDSLKPIQFEKVAFKKTATWNAEVLSAAIVNGKNTDKEKFDAILSWVVNNIKYDSRRYNSGKAFLSNRSLKRTLRRRKGICTDYAALMDSLCFYAGLQNVTITGYVKEVNFDVNDPVYFDNHAWNAVKLNGSWFLYDPTWCSGNVGLDYKPFAKWRIKMIQKLEKRTKKKELKFGSKIKNGKRCNLPKETVYKSKTIDVVRFFSRVFIRVLKWFPFKMEEKFEGVANSAWYLTNPEVFAVTHFPNNPIWSFSEKTADVADFVADMKYYTIPDYLSMDETRHGTFCLPCDDYEASTEMEREAKNYEASLQNNPNNHFLPGNYQLMMGGHLYQEVLKETDSLTKVHLMDSTEVYLLKARAYYKQAQKDARVEAVFHVKKNTAKKYVLLKENRKGLTELNKLLSLTVIKRNQIRVLAAKSRSLNRSENSFLNRFNNNFSNAGPAKKMKDEQIEKIRQKIGANKAYCDSLTTEIQSIQERFKLNLGTLWLNLREGEEKAVPLLNNYFTDGQMRLFGLQDSYKFYIRELRKKIAADKEILANSIDTNLWKMSDSVCKDYTRLVQMVKKRDAAFDKNKRNFMLLRRVGVLTEADVRNFCLESAATVTETICWNSENESLVRSLVLTFNYFSRVMRKSTQIIPWDSRMEQIRYRVIDRHVRRNQMRSKDAVYNNAKLVSRINASLHDHRKKIERKKSI
ncbi:transglutaminase-like domain-containing protein [Fluviicola sp.]|uniref:transglutaminase domain-containing protein n=1 Tax=Fluviicola sp. TaxID=1917219 RepID=UPI00261E6E5C|nr:transglutaminase-like domain-containing protein [Fluviicola sp.]